MTQIRQTLLMGAAIVLAVLVFLTLIRAILGPRFTDRIIAVNMINTMVVAIIVILSVYLKADFLVDVALVYALLSFLTVVVLSRAVTLRQKRRRRRKEREEAAHGV